MLCVWTWRMSTFVGRRAEHMYECITGMLTSRHKCLSKSSFTFLATNNERCLFWNFSVGNRAFVTHTAWNLFHVAAQHITIICHFTAIIMRIHQRQRNETHRASTISNVALVISATMARSQSCRPYSTRITKPHASVRHEITSSWRVRCSAHSLPS